MFLKFLHVPHFRCIYMLLDGVEFLSLPADFLSGSCWRGVEKSSDEIVAVSPLWAAPV